MIKIAQLNDSLRSPYILFIFFEFLMGSVIDINKLYQYIIIFNSINITIKYCDKHGEIIAAPSIRPIRNCLYGSHIGCTRRHSYHIVSRALVGAPANAQIVERTSGVVGRVCFVILAIPDHCIFIFTLYQQK